MNFIDNHLNTNTQYYNYNIFVTELLKNWWQYDRLNEEGKALQQKCLYYLSYVISITNY